ncbi:MAG: leucyl aminopeptidase [Sphingopyxis sp.]|nr:leucyl aminopeptidase [Sphingopyxis sp.]
MAGFALTASAGALASLSLTSPAAAQTAASARTPGQTAAHAQVLRPLSFAAVAPAPAGTLVLPLADAAALDNATLLPDADRAAIARAITSARFTFAANSRLSLRGIGAWDQIMIVGRGAAPNVREAQALGMAIARALQSEPGAITIYAADLPAATVEELATGVGLGQYRSDLFQTRDRTASGTGAVTIVTPAADTVSAAYSSRGAAMIRAMNWTRDISNEPANTVYPESFVARTRAAFAGIPGVTIEVLDVPAMERLGMGAILGVGRGSARPPRMLAVRYRGAGAETPPGSPIVLAGKGITFDSGGISLKPGAGMGEMRMDMSGAASVVGAVLSLSASGAPVDVVAIAALAENMPDGAAIRPGDVLTAYNGMTIEVINTDAEGRLVLADAVSWADATMNPAAIVDVATLTGAIITALGNDYAGLFSRDDALATALTTAGTTVGEDLWRMPLHPSYAADTRSTYADIRNTGTEGAPGAGAGAHFIGAFIRPETRWAHIDIAGMESQPASDTHPGGSTGYTVRLLDRFVRDFAHQRP